MTPTPVGMRCPECAQPAHQGGAGGRRRRPASRSAPGDLRPDRDQRRRLPGRDRRPAAAGSTASAAARSSSTSASSAPLGRRRRVVPAGHQRLPPRQPHPHRLQHVPALLPRPDARAGDRHAALRRPLLRLAARRLLRRAAARPRRAHRRRLRGGLRPLRRHLRDRPRPRHRRARRRDRRS